jgi:hypothetical protein
MTRSWWRLECNNLMVSLLGLQWMLCLVWFLKVKIFIFCVSFFSQVSQMFIVCNDFAGDKHGFHNLKCDLALKCLLMCIGGENIDKDIYKFKILCFMKLHWVQLSIDFGKVVLSCTIQWCFYLLAKCKWMHGRPSIFHHIFTKET